MAAARLSSHFPSVVVFRSRLNPFSIVAGALYRQHVLLLETVCTHVCSLRLNQHQHIAALRTLWHVDIHCIVITVINSMCCFIFPHVNIEDLSYGSASGRLFASLCCAVPCVSTDRGHVEMKRIIVTNLHVLFLYDTCPKLFSLPRAFFVSVGWPAWVGVILFSLCRGLQ